MLYHSSAVPLHDLVTKHIPVVLSLVIYNGFPVPAREQRS